MRIVFAGTPQFSAAALAALAAAGHEIVLVLTQPDRPAGRGMKLTPSAVKQSALALGLPVYQPQTLRNTESVAKLKTTGADVMVVAAYGLILPPEVLDLFPIGCINIHASLLPRWRGAAPIQRALLAGDRETGIAIMRMEAGLDTGPVYLMRGLPIDTIDTAATLHDKLMALGAECIVEALPLIADGRLQPAAQPQEGVTYAAKISKSEAQVDWRRSAPDLDRQIRAFDPFPGAQTLLAGEPFKLWRAHPESQLKGEAGRVLAADERGIVIACGEGALRVTELQRTGGRRLPAGELLRGFALAPGAQAGA